jgi:hypothetical protein
LVVIAGRSGRDAREQFVFMATSFCLQGYFEGEVSDIAGLGLRLARSSGVRPSGPYSTVEDGSRFSAAGSPIDGESVSTGADATLTCGV